MTPGYKLKLAATQLNFEAVRSLVAEGAPIDYRHEQGRTALFLCAELHVEGGTAYAPMCELLCNLGADVNLADDTGTTPLMAACWLGLDAPAKVLIDAGADVMHENHRGSALDHATVKMGMTPGHAACQALVNAARAKAAEKKAAGS
jgi:ankyrin repeat protein